MALFLEVDGQQVCEVENFKIHKPESGGGWGSRYGPPKAKSNLCSFTMKSVPPQGGWINLVDEEGTPVHEIEMKKVDTQLALGGAVVTVTAELV